MENPNDVPGPAALGPWLRGVAASRCACLKTATGDVLAVCDAPECAAAAARVTAALQLAFLAPATLPAVPQVRRTTLEALVQGAAGGDVEEMLVRTRTRRVPQCAK